MSNKALKHLVKKTLKAPKHNPSIPKVSFENLRKHFGQRRVCLQQASAKIK